jgi:hypothetical protein
MNEIPQYVDLEDRWRSVRVEGAGFFTLLDSHHPLRIYFGTNSSADPTLTLVLSERPPEVANFTGLVVESRVRESGEWTMLLQLNEPSAFGEFVAMSRDLARSSHSYASERAALEAFIGGVDRWRRLFHPMRANLLSESRLRGLTAELVVMLNLLSPHKKWTELIHGWAGPFGADQDFQLAAGLFLEVKSTHAGSQSVKISSLTQLQQFGSRLVLALVPVDRDVETTTGVVTLPQLCSSIEASIGMQLDLRDEFRGRLREVGFDPMEPAYQDLWFRLGEITLFDVVDGFPRLLKIDVAPGVVDAEYAISLGALEPYLIAEIEILTPNDQGMNP